VSTTKKGVIGIAPRSSVRVVSQWFDQSNPPFVSTANALAAAVPKMTAGDVLLIESSSIVPDPKFGLLPAEVDPVVFDLIKVATANGITVVEPAGNNVTGGSNLDAYRDGSGKFIFNRATPDFRDRDSGAIIVGAAGPSVPHQRLPFSNYGSRVDCFAWGWDITTCGGFPRTGSSSPQTAYMTDFAGTSGASAIVAGAAVLLQSWAAKHGGSLSTMRLREVMSDPAHNTHSSMPSNDRIGVMPDLRAIIHHLKAPLRRPGDAIVGILIGGVAQGGPGWLWIPGGGITPVPPRGENIGTGLFSPEKRDLLLGLAMHDMASLVTDPRARQQVEQAGAELMRGAIERITREPPG
jgi:Subtilase family